ncbi:MAG: NADH:flavin oxidoreductase, partial [Bacteroidetes bacterium]|nr:NADH:flavin oxidoreductase [Bacteroidota bacterium]
KRSFYFKDKPRKLNRTEIVDIINRFGNSALYSKNAGFDGVQLHAAHGYLIHQFLLSNINNRKDEYGINPETGIGTKFLEEIIYNVRDKCGLNFPVLVKISGGVDYKNSFSEKQFIHLIRFFEQLKVDGIEISYGTMDYALNIFRGDLPLDLILTQNPIYKTKNKLKKRFWKIFVLPVIKAKLKPFSLMYNLDYAAIAKQVTDIPVISVGGFRSYEEIDYAIRNRKTDFVSLCRPLICEPDFVRKIKEDHCYLSQCTTCNYCAIMCDTKNYTKCYQKQKNGIRSKNHLDYQRKY